nr:transposase [Streptomyces sp. BA2]
MAAEEQTTLSGASSPGALPRPPCLCPPTARGPIVLAWDSLNVHKDARQRAFAEAHDWLTLFCLPPYAPDLRRVEGIWSVLRGTTRASRDFNDPDTFNRALHHGLRSIQYRTQATDAGSCLGTTVMHRVAADIRPPIALRGLLPDYDPAGVGDLQEWQLPRHHPYVCPNQAALSSSFARSMPPPASCAPRVDQEVDVRGFVRVLLLAGGRAVPPSRRAVLDGFAAGQEGVGWSGPDRFRPRDRLAVTVQDGESGLASILAARPFRGPPFPPQLDSQAVVGDVVQSRVFATSRRQACCGFPAEQQAITPRCIIAGQRVARTTIHACMTATTHVSVNIVSNESTTLSMYVSTVATTNVFLPATDERTSLAGLSATLQQTMYGWK